MQTNTIPAKLIRLATNYEYSHVGLSLEKNCNEIYSFGRKKLHSIIGSGFSKENKNGAFFKKFHQTKCKIYEIKVTIKQYRKVQKILSRMELNSNYYKYDYLGMILRYFGLPLSFKNRFVCSYFVAYILENAQIYNFDKQSCLIRPKDFEKISISQKIYEGNYKKYNYITV